MFLWIPSSTQRRLWVPGPVFWTYCTFVATNYRRCAAHGGVERMVILPQKAGEWNPILPPKIGCFLWLKRKIEIGPSKNCRFLLTEPVNMWVLPMNGGLKPRMNRSLVRNHMCVVVSSMFETWIHRYAGCEQGGQGSGWLTLCGVPQQVEKCIPDCFNQKAMHTYLDTRRLRDTHKVVPNS